MDFPIFHLDFLGNRLLIAIDAILHVLINQSFAVGGLPLVALLEWTGMRSGDRRWDDLAYHILKVFFIITTTVGALTGVGVWFAASLVNPASIASLIRVFFWGWFTEWLVFVTEVSLILVYFLTWPKSNATPETKRKHLKFGTFLAVFSWITMAIIVAILGFMMDPGNWLTHHSLLIGFLNPIYGPQLVFRTTVAMVMGGLVVGALTYAYTKRDLPFRQQALKSVSTWTGLWIIPVCIAGYWYYNAVPKTMIGNLPVALGTQAFANWYAGFKVMLMVGPLLAAAVLAGNYFKPGRVPVAVYLVPVVLMFALLGQFERVREFIRKPYVIGNYMYANGIRVEDYPLLQRDGILKYATYTRVRTITPENQLQAGREVFILACTRCHTVAGVNSVRAKLQGMYGDNSWNADAIAAYVDNIHGARNYMPPFPGNQLELKALGVWLASLQAHRDTLEGVQTIGIPEPDAEARGNDASATQLSTTHSSGAQ